MLSVLLVVVGFLAMWQIFALITQPPEYLLPSPIAIGKELSIAPGWYFSHASRTIGATLAMNRISMHLSMPARPAGVLKEPDIHQESHPLRGSAVHRGSTSRSS